MKFFVTIMDLVRKFFDKSKGNKISSKDIKNSNIKQSQTTNNITVNNYGANLDTVAKLENNIYNINQKIDNMPRIYSGTGPPPDGAKNGDIYLRYQ